MTNPETLSDSMQKLADDAAHVTDKAVTLSQQLLNLSSMQTATSSYTTDPFIFSLTIFVLACFIGYYVVWKVTPALHTPLMSITNAISSIVIIGAILAATAEATETAQLGLFAIAIASVNIFGGFIVTQRMLQMFKKKEHR